MLSLYCSIWSLKLRCLKRVSTNQTVEILTYCNMCSFTIIQCNYNDSVKTWVSIKKWQKILFFKNTLLFKRGSCILLNTIQIRKNLWKYGIYIHRLSLLLILLFKQASFYFHVEYHWIQKNKHMSEVYLIFDFPLVDAVFESLKHLNNYVNAGDCLYDKHSLYKDFLVQASNCTVEKLLCLKIWVKTFWIFDPMFISYWKTFCYDNL